jgi:hypothetical protein
MTPYLINRADGVKGHFVIARNTSRGGLEFWSKKNKCWCGCADFKPLGKKKAKKLLAKIIKKESNE